MSLKFFQKQQNNYKNIAIKYNRFLIKKIYLLQTTLITYHLFYSLLTDSQKLRIKIDCFCFIYRSDKSKFFTLNLIYFIFIDPSFHSG